MTFSSPDAVAGTVSHVSSTDASLVGSAMSALPHEERLFLLVVAHCGSSLEPSSSTPLLQEVFGFVFAKLAKLGPWAVVWGRLSYSYFCRAFIEEIGALCARRRVDLCLRQTDFHQILTTPSEKIPALLERTEERLVDELIASGSSLAVRQHYELVKRRWLRENALRLLPFVLLIGALGFSLVAGLTVIERRDGLSLAARVQQWFVFLWELFF